MRLSKLMFAAASAICGVVLLPSLANAAVDADVSEACDDDGNVNVTLKITGVEYEQVQWFIDGNPAGKTAFGVPLTGYTAGDGQAHKVEAVYLIPLGLEPDVITVVLPDCANQPTTTNSTSTTATTQASSSTTETVLGSSSTTLASTTSTISPTTATTAVSTTTVSTTTASTSTVPTTEEIGRAPNPATVYVTGIPADDPDGGLVIRSGPSTLSDRLDVVANGTEMTAVNWPPEGRWVQISSPTPGWVGARFVTLAAPGSPESTTSSTTAAITSTVQSTPVALDSAPDELPFGDGTGELESATGVSDPSDSGSMPWVVPVGIALLVVGAAVAGIKLLGNKQSLAAVTPEVASDVAVAPEPAQTPFVAQEDFGTVVLPKRIPKTSRVDPGNN